MNVEAGKSLIDKKRDRSLYFINAIAQSEYSRFKTTPELKSVILFAADYAPMSQRGTDRDLKLVLPSEFFLTVKSTDIYTTILRICEPDLFSSIVHSGNALTIPNPRLKTKNLERFSREQPNKQLFTEYTYIDINSPIEEENWATIRSIYSDPVTNYYLTEAWEMIKYKDITP